MQRVRDLGEVDLSKVLALDLSAEGTAELVEVGHHLDRLRSDGDEPGWAVGQPPAPVLTEHPIPRHLLPKIPESIALATVLERPTGEGDLLEYTVEVWHDGEGALLVTSAVEVACRCETDHEAHPVAESTRTATNEQELLAALDQAAAEVAGWAQDGTGAPEWRAKAGLPVG
jgi:hypothetical protein